MLLDNFYRVFYQLGDLGWVDSGSGCSPKLRRVTKPSLPKSNLPMQNWADSGTAKIKVNPTKVCMTLDLAVEIIELKDQVETAPGTSS